MRTVYAMQLEVVPCEGESTVACFNNLVGKIDKWVEGRYQHAWNTAVSMPLDGSLVRPIEGHSLRGTSKSADNCELFSFEWSHPADGDPSASWLTNCIVARHADSIQFAILLRISTTRIILRPVRFELGRPRLVNDILPEYQTLVDSWRVPVDFETLLSPDIEKYVTQVLMNTDRNLPVIVVSPNVWHGRHSVDPCELFQRVKGFAHVAVLSDKWSAFKLTDIIGKRLSCYDGAVRVYWPGITLDDNPFQHKIFLPQTIRIHKEQG